MRNPNRDQIGIPTPESITNAQIVNVLGILQTLNPFLLHADDYREPGSIPVDYAKLDGGAFSAASATFMKACDRLDSILDDAARWNMTEYNVLFKSIQEANFAQKKFLDAQTIAAEQITRPSFQLKPGLTARGDMFIAFWGDPTSLKDCIVGKGKTPEQALLDFDESFKRTPDEHVVSIAKELGHVFDTEEEPATKPRKKKK